MSLDILLWIRFFFFCEREPSWSSIPGEPLPLPLSMTELTPAGQSHRPIYCRAVQVTPGPYSPFYEKFTGENGCSKWRSGSSSRVSFLMSIRIRIRNLLQVIHKLEIRIYFFTFIFMVLLSHQSHSLGVILFSILKYSGKSIAYHFICLQRIQKWIWIRLQFDRLWMPIPIRIRPDPYSDRSYNTAKMSCL